MAQLITQTLTVVVKKLIHSNDEMVPLIDDETAASIDVALNKALGDCVVEIDDLSDPIATVL